MQLYIRLTGSILFSSMLSEVVLILQLIICMLANLSCWYKGTWSISFMIDLHATSSPF